MKLILLLACSVLIGCGVIFGIVHGVVPHLLTPDMFPRAQAREPQIAPMGNIILGAGSAIREGVTESEEKLAAR